MAASSPWIHQWQVADDLRIMDVPFHIEFSNQFPQFGWKKIPECKNNKQIK